MLMFNLIVWYIKLHNVGVVASYQLQIVTLLRSYLVDNWKWGKWKYWWEFIKKVVVWLTSKRKNGGNSWEVNYLHPLVNQNWWEFLIYMLSTKQFKEIYMSLTKQVISLELQLLMEIKFLTEIKFPCQPNKSLI